MPAIMLAYNSSCTEGKGRGFYMAFSIHTGMPFPTIVTSSNSKTAGASKLSAAVVGILSIIDLFLQLQKGRSISLLRNS